MDWLVIKYCGCYCMSTNSTGLVIKHVICVQNTTHCSFKMDYFPSLKFSKLYTSAEILGLCKLYMLRLTKALLNIITAIEI